MDQTFIDEAKGYETLGPQYFAAQEAAKRFVEGVNPDIFEPIIKKAAGDLYAQFLDEVQNHLTSNVEDNVQGEIWRGVDDAVQGLITGKEWALERYALTGRYEGAALRAAICKHIPQELMSQRLIELEAENEKLLKDLKWEREHRFR